MKAVIGIPARKDDFFPRSFITEEIWSKLENGCNLLLIAPRRVGKTSILWNLFDSPKEGYIIIYEETESINKPNEFYKRLFQKVSEKLKGVKKYTARIERISKEFASRVESLGLKDITVSLGESKINYELEFEKLIENIELNDDRLIILIDEFAQTVENINEDLTKEAAINFLESTRRIRLLPGVHKKIQFVYAGSIGLENIAGNLNAMKFINDLAPIYISPLDKQEARTLINQITGNEAVLSDDAIEYLINKIE
ncbi:MAG TPA: hypothetical protein PK397_12310, partial [Ignavibacteriaceae bacterium]|nr:hypothetical protein [Ignavibacteriaceae bacterium]